MIKEIVNSLSEEEVMSVTRYLSDFAAFYSIDDISEVKKELLIEKICDYFEICKVKNNIKDKYIYKTFADTIFPYLKINTVKENKRINAYLAKLKNIKKKIDKNPDTDNMDILNDYVRIFLCLYSMQLKKPKGFTDKDFSFFLSDIAEPDQIIKSLKKEKKAKEKYGKISLSIVFLILLYISITKDSKEKE